MDICSRLENMSQTKLTTFVMLQHLTRRFGLLLLLRLLRRCSTKDSSRIRKRYFIRFGASGLLIIIFLL